MSIYVKQNNASTISLDASYELGKSKYWIYRRWYDHYIELWNKFNQTSYITSNQSGNMYFESSEWSTDLTDIMLKSVINVQVSINSASGQGLTFPCTQTVRIENSQLKMSIFTCSTVRVTTPRTIEYMCYALCTW